MDDALNILSTPVNIDLLNMACLDFRNFIHKSITKIVLFLVYVILDVSVAQVRSVISKNKAMTLEAQNDEENTNLEKIGSQTKEIKRRNAIE